MKFTSEDLAKAMGLEIGDRVIVKESGNSYTINNKYQLINKYGDEFTPLIICNEEFEILPPIKRLGEKLCMDFDCNKCPLFVINCDNSINSSLYEKLEQTFVDVNDDELYNILKTRLDKEV